ncbi:zinc ribbon domain-containing protein [Atopococcus tabaci]|uniref:zinc ribbon domain-containing protein n=1 Tax=Atopococcus tabaci TaxID=269774 RepID=UPI00041E4331|nr:zinc ribbon domain-containing protein [Atopococcus tabaci]
MKQCEHCQHQNEADAKFCENCGKEMGAQSAASIPTEVPKAVPRRKEDRKPLTKKQKITVAAAGAAAVVLIGGYAFAENYYSFENQAQRYVEVLNTGEAKKIAGVATSTDLNFDITEESVQPYADYIKENKSYVQSLQSQMADEYSATDASYDVYLNQNGKKFFLFDNYDLVMNSVYVDLSTNMEGAALAMNGEEVAQADSDDYSTTVGPIAPGKYTFASRSGSGVSELTNEQQVEFVDGYYENYVDLSLTGVDFDVVSNVEDAMVYLNDKEIGQLTEGEASFGPVSWQEDSVITLKKEYPGGVLESGPVDLGDYDDVYSIDLLIIDEYEAEQLLSSMYYYAEQLTSYDDSDTFESLEELLVGGTENALYQTFTNIGKKLRDDEEVSYVNYEPTLVSLEQTDIYTYKAVYEMDSETNYSYSSGKEDEESTLTFNAVFKVENPEVTGDGYYNAYEYDLKVETAELAE